MEDLQIAEQKAWNIKQAGPAVQTIKLRGQAIGMFQPRVGAELSVTLLGDKAPRAAAAELEAPDSAIDVEVTAVDSGLD